MVADLTAVKLSEPLVSGYKTPDPQVPVPVVIVVIVLEENLSLKFLINNSNSVRSVNHDLHRD